MNRSMRRRVGLLTLGTSAVKSAQMLIALLLVHLLRADAWNEVALALSIYLALLTVASFNLQQSLVFFLPLSEPAQQRAIVAGTARLLAGVGAAVAALLVLVAVPGGGIGSLGVGGCALVGLALAAELPTACAPAIFVSTNRLGRGAAWDLSTTGLQIVAMAIPAATGHGATGVLAGLAVSSIIRRLAFGFVVADLPPGEPAPPRLLARQLAYCLPLGLTLATGVLTRSVDKWVVAAIEPHSIGRYAVAAQELPVLAVLPYAGGAAVVVELVRRFADDTPSAAHGLWSDQAAAMSALVLPVTLFLVVAAPELWALLFPKAYASGVFAFRCFTLIGIHRVTEYGLVLRAANRTASLVRLSALLLGLNAVLAIAGGLLWGGNGVAAGCLVAYLCSWLATVAVLADVFGVPFRIAFPWRRWADSLAIASLAAAVALVVASVMSRAAGAPAKLGVKAVAFTAVVLGARRLVRQAPRTMAVVS